MPKRARKCTAHSCDNKTEKQRPFCASCFSTLNSELRDDLITAFKIGNGLNVIRFTKAARIMFEQRKKNMSDNNEMIEVSVDVKQARDKSWMVWDGTMNANDKEEWLCLPKSLCNRTKGDDDTLGPAEFEVPYWMAKEKGLI